MFLKSFAAHHRDETETVKELRSQGSFISSQHHPEEKSEPALLAEINGKRTICGWNPRTASFVSEDFAVLKKKMRMQKQARIVFFKQSQGICSKTIEILINIQTSTYHSPRATARALESRATHHPSFSSWKFSSATFLIPPAKNPT